MGTGSDRAFIEAGCRSYQNIERVLIALLAFDDTVVFGSWEAVEPDPFHQKVLKVFDNGHSMFRSVLGFESREIILRFRQQIKNHTYNTGRAAIERLRLYSEWYLSSLIGAQAPQFNGETLEHPYGTILRDWYKSIMQVLVESLNICMESAENPSVSSCDDNAWPDMSQIQRERDPSIATEHLALSITDDDACSLD